MSNNDAEVIKPITCRISSEQNLQTEFDAYMEAKPRANALSEKIQTSDLVTTYILLKK